MWRSIGLVMLCVVALAFYILMFFCMLCPVLVGILVALNFLGVVIVIVGFFIGIYWILCLCLNKSPAWAERTPRPRLNKENDPDEYYDEDDE